MATTNIVKWQDDPDDELTAYCDDDDTDIEIGPAKWDDTNKKLEINCAGSDAQVKWDNEGQNLESRTTKDACCCINVKWCVVYSSGDCNICGTLDYYGSSNWRGSLCNESYGYDDYDYINLDLNEDGTATISCINSANTYLSATGNLDCNTGGAQGIGNWTLTKTEDDSCTNCCPCEGDTFNDGTCYRGSVSMDFVGMEPGTRFGACCQEDVYVIAPLISGNESGGTWRVLVDTVEFDEGYCPGIDPITRYATFEIAANSGLGKYKVNAYYVGTVWCPYSSSYLHSHCFRHTESTHTRSIDPCLGSGGDFPIVVDNQNNFSDPNCGAANGGTCTIDKV